MEHEEFTKQNSVFSVDYGWNLLSSRIQTSLDKDHVSTSSIRRIILDIARGPSEIANGVLDDSRIGFYSNRLDPYQVGVNILSAHANKELIFDPKCDLYRLFEDFKDLKISLADIIHAYLNRFKIPAQGWNMDVFKLLEQGKISDKKVRKAINKQIEFIENLLFFFKYLPIILEPEKNLEIVKLCNKLLNYCSACRIYPAQVPKVNELDFYNLLKNYYLVETRTLIQFSLQKVHKLSTILNLNSIQKIGWSVIVTVAFERTVDDLYNNRDNKNILKNIWVFSRSPTRVLLSTKEHYRSVKIRKSFVSSFSNQMMKTSIHYLEENKEDFDSQDLVEELRDFIVELSNYLVRISSKQSATLYKHRTRKYIQSEEQDPLHENSFENCTISNSFTTSLESAAYRGRRRFRMVQSKWKDMLRYINNSIIGSSDIDHQKDDEELTFLYFDCIQLGEILWNSEQSWFEQFSFSRMISPFIDFSMASFIAAFDSVIATSRNDSILTGAGLIALGGDEIHLAVGSSPHDIRIIIDKISHWVLGRMRDNNLLPISQWINDNKPKLVNDGGSCLLMPMWWIGVGHYEEKEAMGDYIDHYLSNINLLKTKSRRKKVPESTLFLEIEKLD